MLFSSLPDGIRHRFIDVSRQAVNSSHFPISVGLRSQALKLKFALPENEGQFIKPRIQIDETLRTFADRYNKPLPKPILHQAYIGETVSLLYSPFYIEDRVVDAVLNQPLSLPPLDSFDAAALEGGRPEWRIQFFPALCPACGWELQGQKDSLVLSCPNCNSLWAATQKGFKQLEFACFTDSGPDPTYLPFWRINTDISGITLASYADLIRVANLPKAVRQGMNDIPFHFWTPAFKVRPRKFLSLSHGITLSQPRGKFIPELPQGALHPVTLPAGEAIESLKINLAGFIKPPKLVLSKLPGITITPKSVVLVFIPFIDQHHELIQPMFRQAVNKNQLSLAKYL